MSPARLFASSLVALLTAISPSHADEPGARWQLSSKGVLTDLRSNMQWTQHDNDHGVKWWKADAYCQKLTLDGGHWRLPTVRELYGLYDRMDATPCGDEDEDVCGISSMFRLTGDWFWSGEAGVEPFSALPVRLRKDPDGPISYAVEADGEKLLALCIRAVPRAVKG